MAANACPPGVAPAPVFFAAPVAVMGVPAPAPPAFAPLAAVGAGGAIAVAPAGPGAPPPRRLQVLRRQPALPNELAAEWTYAAQVPAAALAPGQWFAGLQPVLGPRATTIVDGATIDFGDRALPLVEIEGARYVAAFDRPVPLVCSARVTLRGRGEPIRGIDVVVSPADVNLFANVNSPAAALPAVVRACAQFDPAAVGCPAVAIPIIGCAMPPAAGGALAPPRAISCIPVRVFGNDAEPVHELRQLGDASNNVYVIDWAGPRAFLAC